MQGDVLSSCPVKNNLSIFLVLETLSFLSKSQMQIARALLTTPEVCLWDSGMMDKIKFIILLGHKLFFCLFLLHTVPSILILRFEVSSKKKTQAPCPYGFISKDKGENEKRSADLNMLCRKQSGVGQGELGAHL